jgi:phosphohistidine phosphatase
MELYIVRHGIAQELEETPHGDDAERALTPEGQKKTRQVAKALYALGVRPRRIGASPLARARETAEILAEPLGKDVVVECCDFLAPGGKVADLIKWLKAAPEEAVMVVGHLPDVAVMASRLLAKDARVHIAFKKSAVCCLSFSGPPAAGAAQLEWLLQPQHLRQINP